MKNMMALRETEQNYKQLYLDSRFEADKAILFNDFLEITDASFSSMFPESSIYAESLMEDQYFQIKQDISAVQHIRYLPPLIHTHEFFEMACVLSGTFTNYIGEQKTELHAGDILILAPRTRHAICTYQDDGIMVNILMRSSTFERHFLSLLPDNDLLYSFFVKALYGNSDTPYLLFHTGEDPRITEYTVSILREYQRNQRYKNTMLSSLMSVFFVYLLRVHEKDIFIPTLSSSVMNENTIFIIEYMQKNYNTITLSHLAEFFNYSERQMHRIIKTATGMTFSDNIKKIRMDHAKELLSNPNLTVHEIADILGYYDVSNFRKVFKSYFSVTPQLFREAALNGRQIQDTAPNNPQIQDTAPGRQQDR